MAQKNLMEFDEPSILDIAKQCAAEAAKKDKKDGKRKRRKGNPRTRLIAKYDLTQENFRLGDKQISDMQWHNVEQFLDLELLEHNSALDQTITGDDPFDDIGVREHWACFPRPGTSTIKTLHRESQRNGKFINYIYRCNCQHMNGNRPRGPCAHIIALMIHNGNNPSEPGIYSEGHVSARKRIKVRMQ